MPINELKTLCCFEKLKIERDGYDIYIVDSEDQVTIDELINTDKVLGSVFISDEITVREGSEVVYVIKK